MDYDYQSDKDQRYRTVGKFLTDIQWHPFRLLTEIFAQKRYIYRQRPGVVYGELEPKEEMEVTVNLCYVYLLEENLPLQLNLGKGFSDLLDMGFNPKKPTEQVWFLKKTVLGQAQWHKMDYMNRSRLNVTYPYRAWNDQFLISDDERLYRNIASEWLLNLPSFVDFRERTPKFGPPRVPLKKPEMPDVRGVAGYYGKVGIDPKTGEKVQTVLGTFSKNSPIIEKVETIKAEDFIFLKQGDKWQLGDQYGLNFCYTIGKISETSISPGEEIPENMLCYLPRRPKALMREYEPDSPGRRKLVI